MIILPDLYNSTVQNTFSLQTRGLIGIAGKYALDALEKESILLFGLWCFESVKDG